MPSYTFEAEVWEMGVLWEVQIECSHNSDGALELDDLWLVGYYPEGYSQGRNYVPVNIHADIGEVAGAFHNRLYAICAEQAHDLDLSDADY